MRYRLVFVVIAWAYWALVMQYALNTPHWEIPDEPAHYNYVRIIAEQAALPVLQVGDYDQAYLEAIKSKKFPPDMPIDAIRYESHQPPTYYLLATPFYKLGATTDSRLVSLRLYSALWGVALLALVYRIALFVCPTDRLTALLAVALVAFVPQHLAMLAGVNNDALAEVELAAIVLGLMKILVGAGDAGDKGNKGNKGKLGEIRVQRSWLMVGLLVGLGFVTKTTTYTSVGLVAVTLLLLWRARRYATRNTQYATRITHHAIRALLPALLLGGLWFARDALTYGATDWLGLARHNAVVVGQPRTLELYANYFVAATNYFPIMFRSFWGQFGWMGVPLDARLYDALLMFTVFALGGLLIAKIPKSKIPTIPPRLSRGERPSNHPTPSESGSSDHAGRTATQPPNHLTLILAWFLFTFFATAAYSLEFFQAQGRYLFPALGAIAIGMALGLRAWLRLAARFAARFGVHPAVVEWSLAALIVIAFIALDWYCLFRVLVPALRN